MPSSNKLNITDLDFDAIKSNLKEYLVPSILELNLVFFKIVKESGLPVGEKEKFNSAWADRFDVGKTLRCLAWDTTEFLSAAESKNISLASILP